MPDADVTIIDGHLGEYTQNLAREGGDFIVRRSDGVYAYQLAVSVDDALMGVTRVVRAQGPAVQRAQAEVADRDAGIHRAGLRPRPAADGA